MCARQLEQQESARARRRSDHPCERRRKPLDAGRAFMNTGALLGWPRFFFFFLFLTSAELIELWDVLFGTSVMTLIAMRLTEDEDGGSSIAALTGSPGRLKSVNRSSCGTSARMRHVWLKCKARWLRGNKDCGNDCTRRFFFYCSN